MGYIWKTQISYSMSAVVEIEINERIIEGLAKEISEYHVQSLIYTFMAVAIMTLASFAARGPVDHELVRCENSNALRSPQDPSSYLPYVEPSPSKQVNPHCLPLYRSV